MHWKSIAIRIYSFSLSFGLFQSCFGYEEVGFLHNQSFDPVGGNEGERSVYTLEKINSHDVFYVEFKLISLGHVNGVYEYELIDINGDPFGASLINNKGYVQLECDGASKGYFKLTRYNVSMRHPLVENEYKKGPNSKSIILSIKEPENK